MTAKTFRQRIRISIADSTLQAALDNNARRRLSGRQAAFQTMANLDDIRRRAQHIRTAVIGDLEQYLARFITRVQENGVNVHRARDSAHAVQIILEIAANLPQKKSSMPGQPILLAKSKSMVSEEIQLNHTLEGHGIRVVETDLGEYIVQLRGERPSHIITPAVHLQKEQVGALFHEILGIPYTTDIPTLTAAARKVLRDVFLTADIGLTGVNFGVAETGALCIVTNEGNARMVSTLPPVHVALMGMERLLPSLEDLPLMLSLLPRSATGQKLTVYTQLLHKPFAGQQRHLILLDNGRSRLHASPLSEALNCIRCGACLNACPAFREMGGHAYIGADLSIAPYPGPIGSVLSPALFGENYAQLAQACSLCGACRDVCPVQIDLPNLLTRVRAGQFPDALKSSQPAPGLSTSTRFFLRLFAFTAARPWLYALLQRFAGLGSALFRTPWIRLPAFTGWGSSKDFPAFARRTFLRTYPAFSYKGKPSIQFPPVSLQPHPQTNSPSLHSLPENQADRIAQFSRELSALGGHVSIAPDATQAVLDFLRVRGIQKIHLPPGVLEVAPLLAIGIQVTEHAHPDILVGVTGAVCGLADTGSILILEGAGSPLRASLLPEIHLVILKASDILAGLPQAMSLVRQAGAAVFITGPSRTADIEMTLTIGVHGPREIHVFVIQ